MYGFDDSRPHCPLLLRALPIPPNPTRNTPPPSQSFSLLICVGVGFLVGMVGVNFIEEPTWPTHEMETRGNAWGLLTGICIAIPSGMAVALSILR